VAGVSLMMVVQQGFGEMGGIKKRELLVVEFRLRLSL
jgi:hypothetical protein